MNRHSTVRLCGSVRRYVRSQRYVRMQAPQAADRSVIGLCAFLLQPTICLEINGAGRSTALAVPVGKMGVISRVDYRYWLPATCALYLRPYRYNLSTGTFSLPDASQQHRLQSPKKAGYSLYCFTQQPSPPIDMYSFSDMYNWPLGRGIPRSSRG